MTDNLRNLTKARARKLNTAVGSNSPPDVTTLSGLWQALSVGDPMVLSVPLFKKGMVDVPGRTIRTFFLMNFKLYSIGLNHDLGIAIPFTRQQREELRRVEEEEEERQWKKKKQATNNEQMETEKTFSSSMAPISAETEHFVLYAVMAALFQPPMPISVRQRTNLLSMGDTAKLAEDNKVIDECEVLAVDDPSRSTNGLDVQGKSVSLLDLMNDVASLVAEVPVTPTLRELARFKAEVGPRLGSLLDETEDDGTLTKAERLERLFIVLRKLYYFAALMKLIGDIERWDMEADDTFRSEPTRYSYPLLESASALNRAIRNGASSSFASLFVEIAQPTEEGGNKTHIASGTRFRVVRLVRFAQRLYELEQAGLPYRAMRQLMPSDDRKIKALEYTAFLCGYEKLPVNRVKNDCFVVTCIAALLLSLGISPQKDRIQFEDCYDQLYQNVLLQEEGWKRIHAITESPEGDFRVPLAMSSLFSQMLGAAAQETKVVRDYFRRTFGRLHMVLMTCSECLPFVRGGRPAICAARLRSSDPAKAGDSSVLFHAMLYMQVLDQMSTCVTWDPLPAGERNYDLYSRSFEAASTDAHFVMLTDDEMNQWLLKHGERSISIIATADEKPTAEDGPKAVLVTEDGPSLIVESTTTQGRPPHQQQQHQTQPRHGTQPHDRRHVMQHQQPGNSQRHGTEPHNRRFPTTIHHHHHQQQHQHHYQQHHPTGRTTTPHSNTMYIPSSSPAGHYHHHTSGYPYQQSQQMSTLSHYDPHHQPGSHTTQSTTSQQYQQQHHPNTSNRNQQQGQL